VESTNIPRQSTSFIGRAQELAELKRLLTSTRLVTLSGVGGSGKTRLALQAADALRVNFGDGAWLVELAGLSDGSLLPLVIGQELGIAQASEKSSLEALLDFLRQREILLVLDNCEHLVSACAKLASQILVNTGGTRILATSREPLTMDGEMVLSLSGLPFPEAEAELASDAQGLMQYDAVRLLLERVRRVLPGFEMTVENARDIAQICRRLDGLPLALELASARSNVLTMHQIAERLDDRFSLLVSRGREGAEPRHNTLRAAIDWSYDLLSPAEQSLLRRISVFANGCSLASAEAVCAGGMVEQSMVLDLLSSLVEKSLVVAQLLGRSEARYPLLETIRQYGQEKLAESGEMLEMRNRHLDFYLGAMEEITQKLTGPYQKSWLSWLDDEYGDVRLALAWALDSGRAEEGLRIAVAIYQYWVIRDGADEGLAWVERLLSKANEPVSLAVRANALAYAAFLAGFRGNAAAQIEYGQRATEIAERAGEAGKPALRWALSAQAYAAHAEGDFPRELELGRRAIQLTREAGDEYQLGLLLSTGSFAAMAQGEYGLAQRMLEESLPLLRQIGNPYRIAMALNFTGDLRRCQGNYRLAKEAYEESIAILRQIEAVRDLASALQNLGHTCLHLRQPDRARALFNESLTLQLAQGNKAGTAECLIGFAALATAGGNLRVGVRLLAGAAAIGGQRIATTWAATRLEYEHTLAACHRGLSEQEFEQEQAAGRLMSLDGAVATARNLPVSAAGKAESDLTRRELEIVNLIAQGKSNADIAETLVLSKRTVEKHIAHILMKLEVANRSQVVLWAIENGLTPGSG
jgi:non-specific serine/threonine protein kinase